MSKHVICNTFTNTVRLRLLPDLPFKVHTCDVPIGQMKAFRKDNDDFRHDIITSVRFPNSNNAFVLTAVGDFPFILCLNASSESSVEKFSGFCESLINSERPQHMQLFCFGRENVQFLKGKLEQLSFVNSIEVLTADSSEELYYFAKYPGYSWNGSTFIRFQQDAILENFSATFS
jgi:hypothetical protein